jgi:plasmid stability protein
MPFDFNKGQPVSGGFDFSRGTPVDDAPPPVRGPEPQPRPVTFSPELGGTPPPVRPPQVPGLNSPERSDAPAWQKGMYEAKFGMPAPETLGTAMRGPAQQMAGGAARIANAQSGRDVAGGVSQTFRGAMGTVSGPEVVGPMVALSPGPVAAGIGGSMAVQAGVEKGLQKVGVPKEYSELAADAAGLVPLGAAGKAVAGKLKAPPPPPRPRARYEAVSRPQFPSQNLPKVPLDRLMEMKGVAAEAAEPRGPAGPDWWAKQPKTKPEVEAEYAKIFAKGERKPPVVPETGIPENVARAVDARNRVAMQTTGKPFSSLSNSERLVVDELLAEGRGFSAQPGEVSGPPTLEPPPSPKVSPAAPPAGLPVPHRKEVIPSQAPASSGVQATGGRVKRIAAKVEPQSLADKANVMPDADPDAQKPIGLRAAKVGQRGAIGPVTPRQKPPVPPEEQLMNFGRIRVSPTEEVNLRQEVLAAAKEGGLLPKEVETHAAIVEEAKMLVGADAAKHIGPTDIQTRAARMAMRQRMNTLNREVVEGQQKIREAGESLPTADRIKAEQEVAQKEADLREYIGQWAGIRSADGRNLAMHRIMADSTWDVGFWMQKARRAQGLPPGSQLPEAVESSVRQILVKGEKAATAGDVAGQEAAKRELAQTMAKMDETGWLETISSLRKAGLLTGLKTHARNIGGSGAFQAMEEVSRIPAALVDIGLSVFSKRRTVAGASPWAVARAGQEAATKGLREASQILRSGATAEDLAKMDAPRELNFQKLGKASKVINAYVNGVFRTLGAEDKVFKSYAIRRSLEAQAKVKAINEAKSGAVSDMQYAQRIRQLADTPTEEMAAQAIYDADFATFNNQNLLASGVSMAKSGIKSVANKIDTERGTTAAKHAADTLVFAADMVAPFVRTPGNVAARLADYSVAAPVKTAYHTFRMFKDGITPEHQKAVSLALGRGVTGGSLMMLGYYLAADGKATGTGQIPSGQRNVNEVAGRQPGSVKAFGQWNKTSMLTPGGMLVAMGATLHEQGIKTVGDAAKKPGEVAKIGTRAVLEQPMVQGVSETIEALQDPEARGERVIGSMAGSFVPTAVSDVGTAMDDRRREITKGSFAGAVKQGIQSRLPVLRESLPERRDVFSRPLEAKKSAAVNPFLSSTAKEDSDKLARELVSNGVQIGKPAKKKDESDEEFTVRKEVTGRSMEAELRRVIRSGAYDRAPTEKKQDMLEKAAERGRNFVTQIQIRMKKATPERRIQVMQRLGTQAGRRLAAATR